MSPRTLPVVWREKAEELRKLGADSQAKVLEWCADELEVSWQGWEREPLPLKEAAEESGYSTDHLGRLVREGDVPNAGSKHAPRIRRSHLPRKACHVRRNGRAGVPDLASFEQVARSIVHSENGDHDG